MPKILVTGGAGFIGSNFIEYALGSYQAWEIINLDKLTYAGNPDNLSNVKANSRYSFVKGDITDKSVVEEVFSEINWVVHFAAETHVDRSIAGPEIFVSTNVLGTQILLSAALEQKVEKFLLVSTDEVYGPLPGTGSFDEDSPMLPSNPYAASKAGAELLARSYFITYGLPVITSRSSNNYGPRQYPEKLIPLFLTRALRDQQLPLYGNGLHLRDWLYVEDHCRALCILLEKGIPGEVYNVGAGNEKTNLEIARLLLQELDKPQSLIKFTSDRPGHDRRYAVNFQKITSNLGWQPQVNFHEGLLATIDWYRNKLGFN